MQKCRERVPWISVSRSRSAVSTTFANDPVTSLPLTPTPSNHSIDTRHRPNIPIRSTRADEHSITPTSRLPTTLPPLDCQKTTNFSYPRRIPATFSPKHCCQSPTDHRGDLFDGIDIGGQWLSRHSGLLLVECDTDQEEQKAWVIVCGEGVESGIVSSEDCHWKHQCED